jgi:hypothetical protein
MLGALRSDLMELSRNTEIQIVNTEIQIVIALVVMLTVLALVLFP